MLGVEARGQTEPHGHRLAPDGSFPPTSVEPVDDDDATTGLGEGVWSGLARVAGDSRDRDASIGKVRLVEGGQECGPPPGIRGLARSGRHRRGVEPQLLSVARHRFQDAIELGPRPANLGQGQGRPAPKISV